MHYTTPAVNSTEGVHTFQYRSIDRSLNLETANSLIIRIDKTPPTVTYNGNLGTYNILGMVNITCTASDNLSGVASTTCQNIMGPAYNYNPSSNTFSATATDNAGNIGFDSTSLTLVETFADMVHLPERFVTKQGVALSDDMCAQL